MKILQKIIITFVSFGSIARAMEPIPQKEKETYLNRLPSDICMEIAHYAWKGRGFPNIQGLGQALAVMHTRISSERVLALLKSLSYTCNATDIADHLAQTPLMQDQELAEYVKEQKHKLVNDYNLISYTTRRLRLFDECLRNKDINLNYYYAWSGKGDTPLITAIKENCEFILIRLLHVGVNVNAPNHEGLTPLIVANTCASLPMLQDLLFAGAAINKQDRNGDTVLLRVQNHEIIHCLIKAGADCNIQNKDGTTPLIDAAVTGNVIKMKLLLAAGADPRIKDKAGRTALNYAHLRNDFYQKKEDSESIKLLREALKNMVQGKRN